MMAFTGLRWREVTGLQASCVRALDHRRDHPCIGVEWQLAELNGNFCLSPAKEGSRRGVDIPGWLFDLLTSFNAAARRPDRIRRG